MADAVVVGSGPNGLAAAVTLARAGVRVVVHEAAEAPGGGLRTEELTLPGFRHDVCSAIHPMGRASPFFRWLALPIDWVEPPACIAHPLDDGTAVLLHRDLDTTAEQLGRDAAAYRRLVGPLVEGWQDVEPLVLGPFPPPPRTLARGVRFLRSAVAALQDARSVAERTFETERARALFAGCAAHSLLPLERRPTAGFGLLLAVTGHVAHWPFPRGGSQRIADALVDELRRLGCDVRTRSSVDELPETELVLADVMPRELERLTGGRVSYPRYRHGAAAFKLDWALDGPIPWRARDCTRAGTVHLGGTLEEIAASERAPWAGAVAERPFVLLAQQTLFDDTRAPAGKHTAWAYCHVPNGSRVDMTERIEAQVERFAPGFRELIAARHVTTPHDFERRNRNLVGGDINGGAMDLAQLIFRPAPRIVPYRTKLAGVYICSSATPPGGGVHGMCGYSAALAALRDLAKPS
jgi:phytoene dehydrogenase-like protein